MSIMKPAHVCSPSTPPSTPRKLGPQFRTPPPGTPASIGHMPPEVLVKIFENACASQNAFAIVIKNVSTQWRHIATTSCPAIWTSLRLSFIQGKDGLIPKRCVDILRIYLSNVRSPSGLDLTLRTKFGQETVSATSDVDHLFYGCDECRVHHSALVRLILHEYPEKLHSVVWPIGIDHWMIAVHTFFNDSVLSNVKHLDPSWKPIITAQRRRGLPVRFPGLTSVSFNQALFHGDHLGWVKQSRLQNLTSVELEYFLVDQAMMFLLEIPTLKSFSSQYTLNFGRSDRVSDLARRGVTLRNLEVFKWHFTDDKWTRYLLRSVRMPSLRRLHVYECECRESPDLAVLLDGFVNKMGKLEAVEGAGQCFTQRDSD